MLEKGLKTGARGLPDHGDLQPKCELPAIPLLGIHPEGRARLLHYPVPGEKEVVQQISLCN